MSEASVRCSLICCLLLLLAIPCQAKEHPAPTTVVTCLLSNESKIAAMRTLALADGWKHEYAFGIYADCRTTEIIRGGDRAAVVDGTGFIAVLHTHALFPNSGPSSGDVLLTSRDGISRAVLKKNGKIQIPSQGGRITNLQPQDSLRYFASLRIDTPLTKRDLDSR